MFLFRLLACCSILLAFLEVAAVRQTNPFSLGADYKSFYTAGHLARTDPAHLYDLSAQKHFQDNSVSPGGMFLPFYHPAYEALLYLPLSLLPYQASYRLMLAINVVLAGLVVLALPGLTTLKLPVLRLYPALAVFLFAPVLVAVLQGQDSLLFLLLLCVAWRCFHSGQDFLAGLVIGLMLFRFQLALPLLAVLLVRRRLSLLPGFLVGLCVVAGTSAWLVGLAGTRMFWHLVAAGSLGLNQGAAAQHAVGVHPLAMANLRGLLYAIGFAHWTPSHLLAAVALLSVATIAWSGYLAKRLGNYDRVFAAAVLCSILVSYHMNPHDLSLALLPLALLRTHAALWTGVALFAGSFAMLFYFGAATVYLLAVPLIILLLTMYRQRQPAYSSTITLPA